MHPPSTVNWEMIWGQCRAAALSKASPRGTMAMMLGVRHTSSIRLVFILLTRQRKKYIPKLQSVRLDMPLMWSSDNGYERSTGRLPMTKTSLGVTALFLFLCFPLAASPAISQPSVATVGYQSNGSGYACLKELNSYWSGCLYDGQALSVPYGNYSLTYTPYFDSGYFKAWATRGDLNVSNSALMNTYVSVSGNGNLTVTTYPLNYPVNYVYATVTLTTTSEFYNFVIDVYGSVREKDVSLSAVSTSG